MFLLLNYIMRVFLLGELPTAINGGRGVPCKSTVQTRAESFSHAGPRRGVKEILRLHLVTSLLESTTQDCIFYIKIKASYGITIPRW